MTPIIRELAEHPQLVHRLSVDDYHQMIANGTIEEGAAFELLDGQIVRKIRSTAGQDLTAVGPHHVVAVTRLGDLNPRLRRLGCYMRTQGPLTLPPYDEPEPDGAIVRGRLEDYAERHPGAADVLCLIEVADASLRRDRGYKQRIYADSGIPVYVIVNLADRVVEVYTEPLKGKGRYGRSDTLSARESVELPTAGKKTVRVPVRRLLP